jgi:hypothetical protein
MNNVPLLAISELKNNNYYDIQLNGTSYYLGETIPKEGFDCLHPNVKIYFMRLIQNIVVLQKLQNKKDIQIKLTDKINAENDPLTKQLLETLSKIVENDFKFFSQRVFEDVLKSQCYLHETPSLDDFLKGNTVSESDGSIIKNSEESIKSSYEKLTTIVDNINTKLMQNQTRGGKKSKKQRNKKNKSKKVKKSKSRKYKK